MQTKDENELHTIAVYGSLKRNFGNHRLLRDAEFIGNGLVYDYAMVSLGAFPAIYKEDGASPIQVELYKVTQEQFGRLDNLEGYPSFYDRTIVDVVDIRSKSTKAWIYHFNLPLNREYTKVPPNSNNNIVSWSH